MPIVAITPALLCGTFLMTVNPRTVWGQEVFDVVIRNGRIVDGTSGPAYRADLAVKDGKIVRIGRLPAEAIAHRSIDAAGLVVAPGFIDMMGQSADPMLRDPATARNLLMQGITTINAGEGLSAAPVNDALAQGEEWRTMAEYLQYIDAQGVPVNVAQTVGHTQVRKIVLGDVDQRPAPEDLRKMQQLVGEAMQAGAIGVSTALIYPPATYATVEEIVSLCEVAGEHGGAYFTHVRNEGDRLLEALEEALEIGRQAQIPVHIFHLKAAGRRNWGRLDQAIARIQAARAAGQQVTADVYPYVHNGLWLTSFVHPRHFADGLASFVRQLDDADFRRQIRRELEASSGWENWFQHVDQDWNQVIIGRTRDREFQEVRGESVADLAARTRHAEWDLFFQLLRSETFVAPQSMSEVNHVKLLQQDFVSFCTDVGPSGGQGLAAHPRASGAFPRVIARFVRELGVISLERAVAQGSAWAANSIRAYDRGRIAPGLAADLIVFDDRQLSDRATFAEPDLHAEGMRFVLVNGEFVLDDGRLTGRCPGRVLRGPGYHPPSRDQQNSSNR